METTIGITGGTGFVGSHLAALLLKKGYKVIVFSRGLKKENTGHMEYTHWDPDKNKADIDALAQLDAIVHLAGAGIVDKRWTEQRKKEIVESRVAGTKFLVKQLTAHAPRCKTLIAASAIGYYGSDKGGDSFTEKDVHANDFLGQTCARWEQASAISENMLRRVVLRFGIVLGKEAGAFKEFEKPTRFGIAPILGSGRQIVSWIHVEDLAHMIIYCLESHGVEGIYNAVAPAPVSNATLMQTISKYKKGIQLLIPIPAFALKIALGEMSTEVVKSCTVSAAKITGMGFAFQFPTIDDAVEQLINR